MRVLVSGAGGFIGHHLVGYLKELGYWVRGVDIKRPEFVPSVADEFLIFDLRDAASCQFVSRDVDWIFGLAADMGGMGYIGDKNNSARIVYNNTLMNLNMLEAARLNGVGRYLFSSSACVYPVYRQDTIDVAPLREEHAYPAQPQDAYGWEKLYFELVCGYYQAVPTRVVRFHNVYGPLGTWRGGREKAPAALCRKIAEAKRSGDPRIEIWGDGQQTRSFLFIDDCLRGLVALMQSDYSQPLNLGSDRLVSINELAGIIAAVAGIEIVKVHVPGPQGVRGRNADLARVKEVLDWQPQVGLEDGLERTYKWIEGQMSEGNYDYVSTTQPNFC